MRRYMGNPGNIHSTPRKSWHEIRRPMSEYERLMQREKWEKRITRGIACLIAVFVGIGVWL